METETTIETPERAPHPLRPAVLSGIDSVATLDAIQLALSDLTDPPGWHPEHSECAGCRTCNEVVPMLKHADAILRKAADDCGVARIAAERARQRNVEGWTANHDAVYVSGELSIAAACYAVNKLPQDDRIVVRNLDMLDDAFPWEGKFDKREQHDRLRSLEIAGALIAAEIDRILTAEVQP